MNIDNVILQLRQNCDVFNGNVAGAADFAKGIETVVDMPLPAAYVVPLEDTAGENILDNGLVQQVNERIAVIVEISNSADRRGQTSSDQINTLKYDIFSALLNWRIDPDRAVKGLQYDGGRLLDYDRGRLFWVFEFSLLVTIDDDDGYQVPTNPLDEIDITNTGDQGAEQSVFKITGLNN